MIRETLAEATDVPDWVALIFAEYDKESFDWKERGRVARPTFYITPFITRYHRELR